LSERGCCCNSLNSVPDFTTLRETAEAADRQRDPIVRSEHLWVFMGTTGVILECPLNYRGELSPEKIRQNGESRRGRRSLYWWCMYTWSWCAKYRRTGFTRRLL